MVDQLVPFHRKIAPNRRPAPELPTANAVVALLAHTPLIEPVEPVGVDDQLVPSK
jgi:hypothetical protein